MKLNTYNQTPIHCDFCWLPVYTIQRCLYPVHCRYVALLLHIALPSIHSRWFYSENFISIFFFLFVVLLSLVHSHFIIFFSPFFFDSLIFFFIPISNSSSSSHFVDLVIVCIINVSFHIQTSERRAHTKITNVGRFNELQQQQPNVCTQHIRQYDIRHDNIT